MSGGDAPRVRGGRSCKLPDSSPLENILALGGLGPPTDDSDTPVVHVAIAKETVLQHRTSPGATFPARSPASENSTSVSSIVRRLPPSYTPENEGMDFWLLPNDCASGENGGHMQRIVLVDPGGLPSPNSPHDGQLQDDIHSQMRTQQWAPIGQSIPAGAFAGVLRVTVVSIDEFAAHGNFMDVTEPYVCLQLGSGKVHMTRTRKMELSDTDLFGHHAVFHETFSMRKELMESTLKIKVMDSKRQIMDIAGSGTLSHNTLGESDVDLHLLTMPTSGEKRVISLAVYVDTGLHRERSGKVTLSWSLLRDADAPPLWLPGGSHQDKGPLSASPNPPSIGNPEVSENDPVHEAQRFFRVEGSIRRAKIDMTDSVMPERRDPKKHGRLELTDETGRIFAVPYDACTLSQRWCSTAVATDKIDFTDVLDPNLSQHTPQHSSSAHAMDQTFQEIDLQIRQGNYVAIGLEALAPQEGSRAGFARWSDGTYCDRDPEFPRFPTVTWLRGKASQQLCRKGEAQQSHESGQERLLQLESQFRVLKSNMMESQRQPLSRAPLVARIPDRSHGPIFGV